VAVAPDGSVWFGEQGVPGLGHLYQDGTLVEYAWGFNYPGRSSPSESCAEKTAIWAVALWNGRVWAGDQTGGQLVGLDPATGNVQPVKLQGAGSFPYDLTVGPDGNLWFSDIGTSRIGRVNPAGDLVEYPLPNGNYSTPADIAFANSTVGYYVDVGSSSQQGGVYSFNPQNFSPVRVGGGMTLYAPDSISLGTGGIWVTQHEASSLAFYDLARREWTIYPTSTVSYIDTTLPYFVRANGSRIWFNEHFADRIAVIDFASQSLTEYSIQNERPTNISKITNTLTFALGRQRVWFAEYTGNTIGSIDPSYDPRLSISLEGSNNLRIVPGGRMNFTLSLTDAERPPLSLQAADSERPTSVPHLIRVTPTPENLTLSESPQPLPLTIEVDGSTKPGSYTVLLTVSDGHVYRSIYLEVQVTP
jgi:streptogramin lyase